ncbi:hypothetical protein CA54_20690 [Symmachiella macrocystis]|uniref:Activator of Hsp90 ATPase homologue 1/2-like C-terminal domain-containing protein n=1 Tax=Symmachiella macrocystis TaxID=2527985 RepID=A0A5C6BNC2_9PLAN|nr:SRPBCC domain-containing protein [Symmachiella macrocystis]TWU13237.1 hypothetical protein CA54_20690 [Symmachiella macrocystis]
MPETQDLSVDVIQTVDINAAIGDSYQALIRRLTDENSTPDNKPLPMVLEQWPGGRWFRDLGNGQGHLWGFVQVIKPPTLIEIHGPMFMSYPVAGHIQFRLTQIPGGTELYLRHRALGQVEEEHREGVTYGWEYFANTVKQLAE